jgi:hypothetical protein
MEATATQTNPETEIRVYWINHQYFSDEVFTTLEGPKSALLYVQSVGFEASFLEIPKGANPYKTDRAKMLGSWGAISGFRR